MDQRYDTGLAGALGAAMTALVLGLAIVLAAPRADVKLTRRVLIEGVASIVVGAVTASYLAPFVTHAIGAHQPGSESAVGFLVGVVAWRGLPMIVSLFEAVMRAKTRDADGPHHDPHQGGGRP